MKKLRLMITGYSMAELDLSIFCQHHQPIWESTRPCGSFQVLPFTWQITANLECRIFSLAHKTKVEFLNLLFTEFHFLFLKLYHKSSLWVNENLNHQPWSFPQPSQSQSSPSKVTVWSRGALLQEGLPLGVFPRIPHCLTVLLTCPPSASAGCYPPSFRSCPLVGHSLFHFFLCFSAAPHWHLTTCQGQLGHSAGHLGMLRVQAVNEP